MTTIAELLNAAVDISTETWKDDAICAQTDPELFFPEKGGSTRDAKSVCLGCEVRAQCLQTALRDDERFGIWGGYSERERRRINRDRSQDFQPTMRRGGRPKGGRNPGPIEHGTPHGYWRGCNCVDCTTAIADYNRDKRIEQAAS